MKTSSLSKLAISHVRPRIKAAFHADRYYWEAGTNIVALSTEQCAAIAAGATTLDYGSSLQMPCTIDRCHEGTYLCIDGNRHRLLSGRVAAEDLTISIHHDSSHMNLRNILDELEIATGIEAARWLIHVTKGGAIDVEIAPSVAYIADEIRKCPVTDHVSTTQWLRKYDVKATVAQLNAIFGASVGTPLTAATGKDEGVIDAFYAPLTVHLHRGNSTRTFNATGVTSIRDIVSVDKSCRWHLNGVVLLPYKDVPIWRCCTHSNTELHLYDHAHKGTWVLRETLAGVLRLPADAHGFVPFPTVSGNMFGDAAVHRASDVASSAPATLNPFWLTQVNASDPHVCMDRALLMVDALEGRYGRRPCIEAISFMLPTGQQPFFEEAMSRPILPRPRVRRRYVCYLQCIKDLLNGTTDAHTISLTYSGHTYPVSPLTTWKCLTKVMPAGYSVELAHPVTRAACMAMDRGDFLLEELRTDKIVITLVPTKKRKR